MSPTTVTDLNRTFKMLNGEWSEEYWQLDQAVMDAEALPREDVQVERLRVIRDGFDALKEKGARWDALGLTRDDVLRLQGAATFALEMSGGQANVSGLLLLKVRMEAALNAAALIEKEPR